MYVKLHKVVCSVTTQHQYTVINTQFWLHISVLPNHLQASIYYMKLHSMCFATNRNVAGSIPDGVIGIFH